MLGSGTFGQVVKCLDTSTGQLVGVKVIKNKPAYLKQSMIEVDILKHVCNIFCISFLLLLINIYASTHIHTHIYIYIYIKISHISI